MKPSSRALARTIAVSAILLLPLVAAVTAAAPAQAKQAASTATAPGDVVSARQIDAPGFWYAKVWQIKYLSTDTHDNVITVSGTVVVPTSGYSGGNRPIVGYAPGTHGMGDQCAPSAHLEAGDDQEGGLIHQYGWRGFAVAITDYQGLGTPGDHAYMVAGAAGHALLDIVRAAQRLTDAGLSKNAPVALVGYSQGGHGASWGAQLAAGYAPELNVKGAAAGGTPANLRQVADYNAGKSNFGLVLAAGIGMDTAYPELDLESYLNDAGRAGIDVLRTSCDFSPYADHGAVAGHIGRAERGRHRTEAAGAALPLDIGRDHPVQRGDQAASAVVRPGRQRELLDVLPAAARPDRRGGLAVGDQLGRRPPGRQARNLELLTRVFWILDSFGCCGSRD